jgi:hypothetical protein
LNCFMKLRKILFKKRALYYLTYVLETLFFTKDRTQYKMLLLINIWLVSPRGTVDFWKAVPLSLLIFPIYKHTRLWIHRCTNTDIQQWCYRDKDLEEDHIPNWGHKNGQNKNKSRMNKPITHYLNCHLFSCNSDSHTSSRDMVFSHPLHSYNLFRKQKAFWILELKALKITKKSCNYIGYLEDSI